MLFVFDNKAFELDSNCLIILRLREDLMNSQAFAGTVTLSSCRFLLTLAETPRQTKQKGTTHSTNAIIFPQLRVKSSFVRIFIALKSGSNRTSRKHMLLF